MMIKGEIQSKRLASLDGLRAISILLVCVGHLAGTVNFPESLTVLHNLGNFGVKVFFVISCRCLITPNTNSVCLVCL